MAKITTSDFQKGIFIEFRKEPQQIVDFQFYNPGKGSAVVRTRLKSLKTGKVLDFTFKSGESVEEIPISVREMQYLYKSGDEFVFMNQVTFEQVSLPKSLIGDFYKYIKEGDVLQILMQDGQPLGIRPPKKVRLLVTEAEEGVKGNTVGGARKLVTVETGVSVSTPLFIKKGDVIIIDTETGEYVERVSQK